MPKANITSADEQGGSNYITEGGTYKFRVDSIEEKYVNGHDVADIHLVTEDGKKMKDSLHFTPKAMWRVALFAKACNHPPIDEGDAIDVSEDVFKGKTFTAKVTMKPDGTDPDKFWPEISEFDTSAYPHDSLIKQKNESATKSTW